MNKKALTKKGPERVIAPINIVTEQRGGDGTALFLWGYWIITIGAIIFLNSCMTAAKKAQREAQKQEDARQVEINQLEKMRKQFPCDTSSTVIDTTTAIRFLQGETVTRHDTVFRTDTLIHDHIVNKQHTVVDSGAIKQLQDMLNSAHYISTKQMDSTAKVTADLRHDNDIYKVSAQKWDRLITWLSIAGIGALIAGIVILFFKMKSKIGI